MSKKANKTVVGAFVLGAIGLATAAVVLLGSGKLFAPQKKVVMYFDGSVKGLAGGAPVLFRGVKVGSVEDVALQGDLQDMTFKVPVIAEIDLDRFRMSGVKPGVDYAKTLVERGLRAQLQTQSLLTGQLMIDLDFHPDKEGRLTPDTTGYVQIPTIPSAFNIFAQKLEDLPLRELVERVNAAASGLDRLVNSPEVRDAPRALILAATDARALLRTVDREVGLLSSDTRASVEAATAAVRHADRVLSFEEGPPAEALRTFNATLADARALVAKIDREVGPLSAEARTSLGKLDETADSVRKAATDERSHYQLRSALEQLRETSRSLGSLVDYLNAHPEALLRGKANPKKER